MPTYNTPSGIVHAPTGTPSDREYRAAGYAAVETEAEVAGHASDEGPPVLAGKALDQALRDAGLPLSGSADEKRARLAEHTGSAESGQGQDAE